MFWYRIDPTAEQQWAWSSAGACVFCGDSSREAGCVCRWCDSCTSLWKQAGRDAKRIWPDEGHAPREMCPECIAWAESPEGFTELERQRQRREMRRESGR